MSSLPIRCPGALDPSRAPGAYASTGDAALTPQLVDECGEHPAAGRRDRVADGAAAAVDVDLGRVDVQDPDAGDAHGRERLVDLEERDVADGQARALECLRDRL